MASASNTASILGITFIFAIIAYAVYKLSSVIKNPLKSLAGATQGTSDISSAASPYNIFDSSSPSGISQTGQAINQGGTASWAGTALGGLATGLKNTPIGMGLALANQIKLPSIWVRQLTSGGIPSGYYVDQYGNMSVNAGGTKQQVYGGGKATVIAPAYAGGIAPASATMQGKLLTTKIGDIGKKTFSGWAPPTGTQQRRF